MADPFLLLPCEIRIEILKNLPLPCVYAATRAFLSLAQAFNALPTRIINSASRFYPRGIQRSIRISITIARLPRPDVSVWRLVDRHIGGLGSYISPAFLTPALAHEVLKRAWKIHWATQKCLKDLTSRLDEACRAWTRKHPSEPPAPFSWVEEHRVLLAYWRLQLSVDVSNAAEKFGDINRRDRRPNIWKFIPSHELWELDTIAQYERRKSVEKGVCAPLEPIQFLTEIRFADTMVEPTWPIPQPGGDMWAFLGGQDKLHLNFAARGTWLNQSYGWDSCNPAKDILNCYPLRAFECFGIWLWDKRRMASLGLQDTIRWKKSIWNLWPAGNDGRDSTSIPAHWKEILQRPLPA